MPRRSLVAVPVVAAAAAVLGVAWPAAGWIVVPVAVVAGLAVAWLLRLAAEPRVRAVAEERSRVLRLLDELPTAVLLLADGKLTYANPAAVGIFGGADGAAAADVLGGGALADAIAETGRTGQPVEVEAEHGERHLVGRASATAPGEVALAITDLTAVRRVEAVRRDFVTNASHELKTPVAGIQALSESLTLALERDPERAYVMIDRLHAEAERLGQLVRDLLDLARLEDPDAGTARERIDVGGVIDGQLERLARQAKEHAVQLAADCPEPVYVEMNPADLRLVIVNLLDNAVQYNRPGGEVRVSVRPDGDYALIEVADTGIGIPQDELDRVFERFYRVDKGRSRRAGGTGLGLSIVRHAVRRQQGTVNLDSTLGVGSTFRVWLPLADTSEPARLA